MILLHQMIAFFIFMMIGYGMRKKDVLDEKGASAISWLIANAANPALILSGAISDAEAIPAAEVGRTLLAGAVFYAAMLVAAYLMPIVLRAPHREVGIYRNMTLFTNVGFMGFPLVSAMLGARAVLYASIFIMPFHFLVYSYGIWNFEKYSGAQKDKSSFRIKRFFNVGVIASLVAIALNFLKPPIPLFASTAVTHLSNATASLSMINVGAFLAGMDLKKLVTDKRLLAFAFLRMLPVSILGTLIMQHTISDPTLLTIGFVMIAAPTGTMAAIMADRYDKDSDLTVRGVSLTTLMSVITIPLISWIMGI